jgi:hypothetical protein
MFVAVVVTGLQLLQVLRTTLSWVVLVVFFIIMFLDNVCMGHISTIFTIPVNFTCS